MAGFQSLFTPYHATYTADGATTSYALGRPYAPSQHVFVYLDRLLQIPGTEYSVVGNSVVFGTAPISGTAILILFHG